MSDQPTENQPKDNSRRTWIIASCATGGGVAAATAVPFAASFWPSEKAQAAGAPVEIDISDIAPGNMKIAEWRGKPVWIVRRTPEMIASLKKTDNLVVDPDSKIKQSERTPMATCQNKHRSIKEEYLVLVGICTHLGCSPKERFKPGPQPSLPDDWQGGFLCPCHGSTFDLAGRVFKNKPAPDNLAVPPHKYLSATRLLIGEADKA
jgi:ubiquinol-cytochrome c reductase iron-sulfur subunit